MSVTQSNSWENAPSIERYLARPRDARTMAELDAVFFETSGTQTFASAADRDAFRERWLGRYLTHDPQHAFLALTHAGSHEERLVGYLVGSVDDPAQAARFADLGYFKALSHLTAQYPAQLHVNLAEGWRGHGVGRALVDRFCGHVQAMGLAGVHVFTGRGLRNVRFYDAAGFCEVGATHWNGHEIVMLARRLT